MPQLIGALFVLYLLYLLVVYIILPGVGIILAIGLATLGCVAAAGLLSGIGVGLKNFAAVLIEAHKKLP